MASQRWVSDMQSHHAMPSGLGLQVGDGITADVTVDNVVPLFAPRVGSLAELVAAAAGPTEPRELLGESEIRANFRAVMLEAPPSVRRRHKLAPFAIAAGSVAGLVAGRRCSASGRQPCRGPGPASGGHRCGSGQVCLPCFGSDPDLRYPGTSGQAGAAPTGFEPESGDGDCRLDSEDHHTA